MSIFVRTPVWTLALLLAACQPPESTTETTAPEASPAAVEEAAAVVEAAVATTEPSVSPELAASLATRSEADRGRDAGRKPGEVVTFLGIESGMTVVDVFAASGWYTEVLSHAVGAEGTVYAQNTELMLSFRDGANQTAITARLEGDRLPNVQRLDAEIADLGLAPASIDAAIFALNFHDVYNNGGAEAAGGLLQVVHMVLKPGGILGVIDHAGAADNDNAELHRIEKAKVLEVIAASPFTLDAESDLLSNPDDDLSAGVFTPGLRGHTDRFVLRLKK